MTSTTIHDPNLSDLHIAINSSNWPQIINLLGPPVSIIDDTFPNITLPSTPASPQLLQQRLISAITHCISTSNHNILARIIDAYEPNLYDRVYKGCSAFVAAVESGNVSVVECIASYMEPDYLASRASAQCMRAVSKGFTQLVKHFFENDMFEVDLDKRDKAGNTYLHEAAKRGNLELVKFLWEEGFCNDLNNAGETPFMLAATHGHVEILRFMLRIDDAINLDDVDRKGRNVLQKIALTKYDDVAHMLVLEYGMSTECTKTLAIPNARMKMLLTSSPTVLGHLTRERFHVLRETINNQREELSALQFSPESNPAEDPSLSYFLVKVHPSAKMFFSLLKRPETNLADIQLVFAHQTMLARKDALIRSCDYLKNCLSFPESLEVDEATGMSRLVIQEKCEPRLMTALIMTLTYPGTENVLFFTNAQWPTKPSYQDIVHALEFLALLDKWCLSMSYSKDWLCSVKKLIRAYNLDAHKEEMEEMLSITNVPPLMEQDAELLMHFFPQDEDVCYFVLLHAALGKGYDLSKKCLSVLQNGRRYKALLEKTTVVHKIFSTTLFNVRSPELRYWSSVSNGGVEESTQTE